jgi:small subunit ribosomal protein S20
MPNIKSAMKRMRSDAKKHTRNQAAISELKTLNKKLLSLTTQPDEARKTALELISRYDRAVTRGIIPKGRAARKKSRISHFVARLTAKKN